MTDSDGGFWYPTVGDVLSIHDDIIDGDPGSEPGIHDEDRIQFVIDYVKHGHFGNVPGTVHEKAFHLMRLLAANHLFADGNKRTALNTTVVFYATNGRRFDYGDDIRSMLKLFSVREDLLDEVATVDYFSARTSEIQDTDLLGAVGDETDSTEPGPSDPNS